MARHNEDAVAAAARAAITKMRGQGLTQTDIAKQLGTSQPTVSRWEKGASTPSAMYVKQLAAYAAEPGDVLAAVQGTNPASLEERVAALEQQLDRIEHLLTKGA